MKHRARYAIVSEILETCRKPARQTHIMYRANLSYEGLRHYLNMLVDSELLKIDETGESPRTFLTTKKGLELLGHSRAIEDLLAKSK
ncbi:MAG: winged helix-turn-helix domain-containing protein [Nitrososphaerales archaeon]